VRTVAGTAGLVFDLVRRHDIACDALNTGWIQPAHSSAALATVEARARQWQQRGAEAELLDRQQVASLIGSQAYRGGWIDRRGGSVQPLSYARGLASIAARLGAGIFARSGVRRLQRDGGTWLLETEAGEVRAEQVVIATNGYTGELWPRLRQTVVPAYSLLVATKPLSENLRGSILPGGQPASDTLRLLRYYRMDAHGRFVLGARSPMREQPRASDASDHRAAVIKLFPQLEGVPFEFMWSGRVAMTADHLPHLHELAPGLHAGLGYNGRGVGMATMMGRLLAERLKGVPAEAIDFPTVPLRPLPFHGWNRFAIRLLTQYYRLRDAME
jgi:glycine/D-amino acid oxidase-like deaminating enzyme